jgi:hypothetical protein
MAKIKLRTDPTGVRFDIKQLEFLKEREKLETSQQVINFLLEDYYMRSRYPIEKIEISAPIVQSTQKSAFIKSFNYYLTLIKDLEMEEDCKDFVTEVQASANLTSSEKRLLIERLKSKWS